MLTELVGVQPDVEHKCEVWPWHPLGCGLYELGKAKRFFKNLTAARRHIVPFLSCFWQHLACTSGCEVRETGASARSTKLTKLTKNDVKTECSVYMVKRTLLDRDSCLVVIMSCAALG